MHDAYLLNDAREKCCGSINESNVDSGTRSLQVRCVSAIRAKGVPKENARENADHERVACQRNAKYFRK